MNPFLLGGNRISQCQQASVKSDYFLKQIQYIRHLHQWTRQYVWSSSCQRLPPVRHPFLWSSPFSQVSLRCTSPFSPQMERWTREHVGAGAELRSEVDPLHQSRLQGDGELVERVQDAGEAVHGGTVPQQSALLVRPRCQGELGQEGEPLGEEPVPARRNRSVVRAARINTRWSLRSN